ncbi:MAG: hypothetical protein HRT45_00875 [Bdellovibrionales bacterium]|nr:hypothetical protein [Bdellovibrionales bacterium]
MVIRKYWVSIQEKVVIDGQTIELTCYGGSNRSERDAIDEAEKNYQ